MRSMKKSGRPASCLVAAIVLCAALYPGSCRAVAIDAAAFEINKPNMQVIICIPLRASDSAHSGALPIGLTCDVHLGVRPMRGDRIMLDRRVIVEDRCAMLLTVTVDDDASESKSRGILESVISGVKQLALDVAGKIVALYSKMLSFYAKALLEALRGFFS